MGPSDNQNPPNDEFTDKIDTLNEAVNAINVAGSDSDDDVVDATDFGYQLLPQEPNQNESEHHEGTVIHEDLPVPDSPFFHAFQEEEPGTGVDQQDAHKVTCGSTPEDRLTLNTEHIETIKASMAGFTLPASSIPDWANVIPEDQWKKQLFQMISSTDNKRLQFDIQDNK
ncbi:hypothetical protein CHUAL_003320 [Chamberlinius hualienensis]